MAATLGSLLKNAARGPCFFVGDAREPRTPRGYFNRQKAVFPTKGTRS